MPIVVTLDVGDPADDHRVGVHDQVIVGRGDHHAGTRGSSDDREGEESEQSDPQAPGDA